MKILLIIIKAVNKGYVKKWVMLGLLVIVFTTCNNRKEPIRILYGGIAHESNTFIPYQTGMDDFTVLRGSDGNAWIDTIKSVIEEPDVEIIFSLVARSGPYGVVSREAYESFRDEILDDARSAGRLDGVMLEMHGAMHVEGYPDAQLDFIKSLREIVGNIPISASFDLHGNMSSEFVSELDLLTAYRTAPHIDAFETVCRGTKLLVNTIRNNQEPDIVHVKIPILIPGEKGITASMPLNAFYRQLPEISQKEGLLDASIFVGMPWTDVNRAGMSIQVVYENPEYRSLAEEEAYRLASGLWDIRRDLKFDVDTDNIDGAIQTTRSSDGTFFITDSGDNTTAGATGDGTLVLEKLLEYNVEDAVLAGIFDPEAVIACEQAGIGSEVDLEVGGKLDTVFSKPFRIHGKVIFITPSGNNANPERRPVVVQIENVKLVLLSSRRSFISPEDFEEVNIDPLSHKIVVVKLGYLFQGLRDIAPNTIMALTPGFANQEIEKLKYFNISRPIYPLDPDMDWSPQHH